MSQYLAVLPKSGEVIIIPIAAPKKRLAPKRLEAEIATRIGMKINGAADIN